MSVDLEPIHHPGTPSELDPQKWTPEMEWYECPVCGEALTEHFADDGPTLWVSCFSCDYEHAS